MRGGDTRCKLYVYRGRLYDQHRFGNSDLPNTARVLFAFYASGDTCWFVNIQVLGVQFIIK